MKRNLITLSFVVVFVLMAGFTFANEDISIDIPFAFYAGDQIFPAGQYHFDMNFDKRATGSFVCIWAPKGITNKILITTAGSNHKNATANQLVFNKYGPKLFLFTVSVNGHEAILKTLNLEKRAIVDAGHALGIIRIAMK